MREVALKIDDRTVVARAKVADSFVPRLVGLMGRKTLADDEAIVFPKCSSVHTFFMRFSIDVIYVAKNGEVVHVEEGMRPWRLLLPRPGTKHVIEMAAGRAAAVGIRKGVRISCPGVWL